MILDGELVVGNKATRTFEGFGTLKSVVNAVRVGLGPEERPQNPDYGVAPNKQVGVTAMPPFLCSVKPRVCTLQPRPLLCHAQLSHGPCTPVFIPQTFAYGKESSSHLPPTSVPLTSQGVPPKVKDVELVFVAFDILFVEVGGGGGD